jgi:hypothetical protein
MSINTFCKIEDYNKNKYILTDKYNQPLQCIYNSCYIKNLKKFLDDPVFSNDSQFDDTQIPCKENPIDKSNINFNNYNIATINKDIVIKDKNNKIYTVQEIEKDFDMLYLLDKDNLDETLKIKAKIDELKTQYQASLIDQESLQKILLNLQIDLTQKAYDYKQKILIKDISSNTNYNFKIISSPFPTSTGYVGFDKYMIFTSIITSDISDNTSKKGQTEYTITLGENYNIDILVVGGGGGGGAGGAAGGGGAGGGAGGGGVVYIVNKTLVAGTYKIIVGSGGAFRTSGNESMITLNNKIIMLDGISVIGKGGGASGGGTGGSGGGGDDFNGSGGSASQGNTFWNGISYIAGGFNGENGDSHKGGAGGSSGHLIDITGYKVLYGKGGAGDGLGSIKISDISDNTCQNIYDFGSIKISDISNNTCQNIYGFGGAGYSSGPGGPGVVIIRFKQIPSINKNSFCKVEDSNKNKYILTDKYKQPLQCQNDSCIIVNTKKVIEDPKLITSFKPKDFALDDTKIKCKAIRDSNGFIINSEPINISNINFDNYNIASINKNIVIINKDDKILTTEQIENDYNILYSIDKNNSNEMSKIQAEQKIDPNPRSSLNLNFFKNDYNYKQKILIEEDITKVNVNAKAKAKANANILTNILTNVNILTNENINISINMYIGAGILLIMCIIFVYIFSNRKHSVISVKQVNKIKKNK